MMPWLIIVGVVVWRLVANQKKGSLTVERKAFLRHALHWTDTAKLEKAAKLFDKAGLSDQAKILRNRIDLRKQPRKVLEAREQVLRQALVETDPAKLENYAKLFADQGATNTADLLKSLALALRVASSVTPVVIPPSRPNPPAIPPPGVLPPPVHPAGVQKDDQPVHAPVPPAGVIPDPPVMEQLNMQVAPVLPPNPSADPNEAV